MSSGVAEKETPVRHSVDVVVTEREREVDNRTNGSGVHTTIRKENRADRTSLNNGLIRSLKKAEGEPLMRRDIQMSLLEHIFHDDTKVFTCFDGSGRKMTFGDLYTEDLLQSNKLSKTLKEKFMSDMPATKRVAMVALLVNIGRINTTLVFTPTQTRTYNPIPTFQAGASDKGKMLQDAPRLKGILKGACEGQKSPGTWEILMAAQSAATIRPLSNPINLIFLFASNALRLSCNHFGPPNADFNYIFSNPTLSSASRARAFLWLCYFYLETNGSLEEAEANPFGSPEGDLRVPPLEAISEADAETENVDTPEEIAYGLTMGEERRRYLAQVELNKVDASGTGERKSRMVKITGTPILPRLSSSHLDVDGTPVPTRSRATSPIIESELHEVPHRLRSSGRKKRKHYDSQADSGSDAEHRFESIIGNNVQALRFDADYRSKRIGQIIRRRIRCVAREKLEERRVENAITRQWRLHGQFDDLEQDSDQGQNSESDAGEEAAAFVKALRRAERRSRRSVVDGIRIEKGKEEQRFFRADPDLATPNSDKLSIATPHIGTGFKIRLKF